MSRMIDANYENGVFRPLAEVPVKEGERVALCLAERDDMPSRLSAETEAWAHVYDGLSDEEIEEIEKIALNRSSFHRAARSRLDGR